MKKTLALILAIVMCFSLFAIGASAASEEFTDKAEINHTEAVNLLVGLGVINGMGDGTFAPNGTVTRAQMCQIVAKICNGGVLPNVNTTEQHFTDVPTNHWAFQAVEYCVGKGIVAGFGDGTFKPEQALTASQCAKMLLVAMGYDETAHKLTGASWEIYTAIYANANDFYKELADVAVDQPITRENVAQMARNMLDARVVKAAQEIDSNGVITTKYSQTNAAGTADNPDVIEEYFGVVIENGYLTGSSYNKTKKEWTYTVSNKACYGGEAIADNDDPVQAKSLVSKTDYNSLTGRKVVFVYDKDDTKNVFDIYAHEDSSLITTAILDDIDDIGELKGTDDEITVADVDYKLSEKISDTGVWKTSGKTAYAKDDSQMMLDDLYTTQDTSFNLWCTVKFIDNTGDDKIDAILVQPATIAKVSALTSKSFSLTTFAGSNGLNITETSAIDLDDEDWAFGEGIEKKDYVVVKRTPMEVYTVTAMTEVSGEATAVKTLVSDNNYAKAKVDGVYYNFYEFDGSTAKVNTKYEFFAYNGFAFDVTKKGAASTDLLLVKKVETSGNFGDKLAKVMFPDGSTKTVTLDDSDTLTAEEVVEIVGTSEQEDGGRDTLFTYEVNKDGEYELEALVEGDADEDNHAGFDGLKLNNAFQKEDSDHAAKLAGMVIDDDAIIMVKYDDGDKYTVIKGSDLKTYTLSELTNVQALYDENNGVNKVQFAFIDAGARKSFGSDDIYGYVTKVIDTTKVDGTTYTNCLVWTVDGEIEASIDNGTKGIEKGDCLVLTKNSDGTYDLDKANSAFTEVAIIGYSESDKVLTLVTEAGEYYTYDSLTFDGKKLPEDTTVLNVDTDNHKGIGSGDIEIADDDDKGNYTVNAVVYMSDEDTMCLIIDISNNDWNLEGDTVTLP